MSGIFLIIFLLVWGAVAVLLGNWLSKLFKRFTTNAQTGTTNLAHYPLKGLLIAVVFLLPIADEIIAYPRYYQMCEGAGYKFALGMDAKKAFRRPYYAKSEYEVMRLFPNSHLLSPNEDKNSGVVVELKKLKIIDTYTGEIILTSDGVKPIHSLFAIPWEDGRHPWLLHGCDENVGKNGEKSQIFFRELQLERVPL